MLQAAAASVDKMCPAGVDFLINMAGADPVVVLACPSAWPRVHAVVVPACPLPGCVCYAASAVHTFY